MVKGGLLILVVVGSANFCLPGTFALETRINKLVYNNNGLDTYSFEFETSDGTYRREDGGLMSSPEGEGLVVRGEYGYIDPTGRYLVVRYIADHNGFQPQTQLNDVFGLFEVSIAAIYTYEDVELRRIFPGEFPQDTVIRSGAVDPEHLGRYAELKHYFKYPKARLNSHFEELACYEEQGKKVCRIDKERYSPEEDSYYYKSSLATHMDRRRVYCLMLLCFTEDELDRVVSSF